MTYYNWEYKNGNWAYYKFQYGEVTIYYNKGDKYIGEFNYGKSEGEGKYHYNKGDKYIGELLNKYFDGKRHFISIMIILKMEFFNLENLSKVKEKLVFKWKL